MIKKRILKNRIIEAFTYIISALGKLVPKGKFIELIALILLASILHELGHIIVGGGVKEFRYPGPDMLSAVVIVQNGSLLSEISGFLFTLPLLLVTSFPRLLLLILMFQSRYDFLDILAQLHIPGVHIIWPAPM